jgi:nucleoside-diphosphate-sugar epimerase
VLQLPPVIILGCGYTGQIIARRLLARGRETVVTTRHPSNVAELGRAGARVVFLDSRDETSLGDAFEKLPRGAISVHSIPIVSAPETRLLRDGIADRKPVRIVYISSTSVYGSQTEIKETTEAHPAEQIAVLRIEEERWVTQGPWSSLIVRSAAIYGPGRGVHTAVQQARPPRSSGKACVSRIHVQDLAAIIVAGVDSHITGAWPVADDYPCSSAEVAEYCTTLLRLPAPKANSQPPGTLTGRRIDGRGLRDHLGINLMYPTYEAGILASLAEERIRRSN